MYANHFCIIPMELIYLLLHIGDELLHCYFVLWVVLSCYLVILHILYADLVDALLRALILEGCVDTGSVHIEKIKGVLLVKVGSPFNL